MDRAQRQAELLQRWVEIARTLQRKATSQELGLYCALLDQQAEMFDFSTVLEKLEGAGLVDV